MVTAGYVRHVGLSEVSAETVARAQRVHPIADLQIEWSLVSRDPEARIFPALRTQGVGVTAYGLLSRGLLSGSPIGARDFRAHLPRFSGDNLAANARLVEGLRTEAARHGVAPAALAIAWALAKVPDVVPVVGARTRRQLAEALAAVDLAARLDADALAALEAAVPAAAVAGTRYQPQQMQALDSER